MSTVNDSAELLHRASQLIKENNKKEASQLLHEYLIANPGDNKVWQLASFAYDTLDEQINAIEQALKYSPQNERAKSRYAKLRSRQVVEPVLFKQSSSESTRALSFQSPIPSSASDAFAVPDTSFFLERGKQLLGAADHGSAINEFTQALALNPQLAEAYMYRGLARANQHNFDAAILDYNEAIRINPNYDMAYANRGISYDNRDQNLDWKQAADDYTASLQLDPQASYAAEIYQRRGYIRYIFNDHQSALADFDASIRLDPSSIRTYKLRAEIRSQAGDQDGTLADLSEIIRLEPDNPERYCERALHYRTQHKPAIPADLTAALADYGQALRLNPNYAAAYKGRAHVYVEQKNYNAALSDYAEAVRRAPQDSDIYFLRSDLHYEMGNTEAALEDLNQGLRINPEDTAALYARGIALARRGNRTAAIADFEAYLRLNGSIPDDVQEMLELLRSGKPFKVPNAPTDNSAASSGGTADFILHYWPAFVWLSIALAELLIAAALFLSKSPGGTRTDVTPLILIAIVIALFKSVLRGFRPSSQSSSMNGKIAEWVLQIVVTTIIWPFAETFGQIRFLFKARDAWKSGQVLVNDKDKMIRSA